MASFNFETGEIESQRISEVIVTTSEEIVEFAYADGTLSLHTPSHPYYVPAKGWCSYSPFDTRETYDHPELREVHEIVPGDHFQSDRMVK